MCALWRPEGQFSSKPYVNKRAVHFALENSKPPNKCVFKQRLHVWGFGVLHSPENSAFLTEYMYLFWSGKGFQLMAGRSASPLHGPPTDLKGLENGN